MKKIILALLIVIILAVGFNTASALTPLPPYFSLLITDYRLVDSVTFILTDSNGIEITEVHENSKDAETTKVRLERIHNFTIDYMDVEYGNVEGGHFEVVVKMKDSSEYISEHMDGTRLYKSSDYVFDTEQRAFEDREIESRLSDGMIGFLLAICLFFFYIVVFVVKLIAGIVYNIKPLGGLLAIVIVFNILSIIIIETYYLYILNGIAFVVAGIIILGAFAEYFILKKICKNTPLTKIVSCAVIPNIVELAGAGFIIGIILSIVNGG